MDCYLELNQIPTRKEQIHSVMSKIDPMHEALDQGIRLEKSELFHSVVKQIESAGEEKTEEE